MTPLISEVSIEPCQSLLMEIFIKNSSRYLVVNYSYKKASSKMFLRLNNPFQAFRITNNATQIIPFNV